MTHAALRTNFNSSRLLRLLADLSDANAAAPAPAFAERLGQWVNFADAYTLYAAHNADSVRPAGSTGGSNESDGDIAAELARIRTQLTNSITESCALPGGKARIKFPWPKADTPREIASDYEPLLRFHLAHQRDMESAIAPLRAQARSTVARANGPLRQLAELDAAFDGILCVRERKLLATVPMRLKKRFEHLLQAHQQKLGAAWPAEDTAAWSQPGSWLANYCRELQGVLLAELDMRLLPVTGLIEAISNEVYA